MYSRPKTQDTAVTRENLQGFSHITILSYVFIQHLLQVRVSFWQKLADLHFTAQYFLLLFSPFFCIRETCPSLLQLNAPSCPPTDFINDLFQILNTNFTSIFIDFEEVLLPNKNYKIICSFSYCKNAQISYHLLDKTFKVQFDISKKT